MIYKIEGFLQWLSNQYGTDYPGWNTKLFLLSNREKVFNALTINQNYGDYLFSSPQWITQQGWEPYYQTVQKWKSIVDKKESDKKFNNAQEFFINSSIDKNAAHLIFGEISFNQGKSLNLEITGSGGFTIITNFLSGELDLSIFPNLKKLTLNTKEQNFAKDFFINISKNKNSVEIENIANWGKRRILVLPEEIRTKLTEQGQELKELTNKLTEHDTNLTNIRSLLDKANSELTNKAQELTELKEQFRLCQESADQNNQDYCEGTKELEEIINNQRTQLTTKTEELNDLKAQFGVKDETIKTKEQEITTKYQELVISNRELDKLKADYQTQQTKITELESQLTGLALGSGLLVKQVEELTNQLNTSQLAEQSAKLEKEIKENLLVSKENELKDKDDTISQQATKLNSYQQIIRNSEANLSKAQDIISTKTEQIEKLEEERNNLEEELEQAQERITNLETTLLNSQTQINHLEIRIKDLENDNANQIELDKLRKQLIQEQNNYQQVKTQSNQQIAQLQNELTQLNTKEAQLSLKIKELTTKQEKVKVEVNSSSLWSKIKTPLLIFGGIGIIFIAYKLIRNKWDSS